MDVWPAAISNKLNSLFGKKKQARNDNVNDKNKPVSVGVVIPVYNDGKAPLLRTLRELERATSQLDNVQVVVADGGCTDDTMEAVTDVLTDRLTDLSVAEPDYVKVPRHGSQNGNARGCVLQITSAVVDKDVAGSGRGPTLNCGAQVSVVAFVCM
jgi:cellulose synthase/poly-beta-1,6-N-acetylglucosamine synthase-like glycosyltransferase